MRCRLAFPHERQTVLIHLEGGCRYGVTLPPPVTPMVGCHQCCIYIFSATQKPFESTSAWCKTSPFLQSSSFIPPSLPAHAPWEPCSTQKPSPTPHHGKGRCCPSAKFAGPGSTLLSTETWSPMTTEAAPTFNQPPPACPG